MPGWCAGSDDYRLGVDAFKQGRYEEARQLFIRVYDAGGREPTLFYNLGSAEFKLGDYSGARRSFEAIANDPKWGALAEYNLGLIEDKLGNVDAAQRHYRVAYGAAQSDKLKELAARKLDQQNADSDDDDWFGLVSLGAGYDDNVVLLNDQSLVDISNESDYFAEAFASASRFVQGNVERGWRADAVVYYRGYNDLNDFDYGSTTLGMTYNTMTPTAQWQLGGRANAQFVGGDAYTASATSRVQLLRPVGEYRMRARNDTTYVDGADHYGYLTGWQNRTSIQVDRRIGSYALRASYEFEWNDRRDSTTPTEFFSYSPIWHRFHAAATRSFTDALELELRATYETSRYGDDNVEINADGAVVITARDDDRVVAALRLTYHPFDSWNAFGEYVYSDNSSKFSEYEYTDNQIMLGMERWF